MPSDAQPRAPLNARSCAASSATSLARSSSRCELIDYSPAHLASIETSGHGKVVHGPLFAIAHFVREREVILLVLGGNGRRHIGGGSAVQLWKTGETER